MLVKNIQTLACLQDQVKPNLFGQNLGFCIFKVISHAGPSIETSAVYVIEVSFVVKTDIFLIPLNILLLASF